MWSIQVGKTQKAGSPKERAVNVSLSFKEKPPKQNNWQARAALSVSINVLKRDTVPPRAN